MQAINKIVLWDIESQGQSYDKGSDVYLDKVLYNKYLEIFIKSEYQNIKIIFKKIVAYRVLDESYLLEYWNNLSKEVRNITFCKVENSSFLKDIEFLSNDFFVDGGSEMIEHFAIFTSNDCVEIISDISPLIIIEDAISAP